MILTELAEITLRKESTKRKKGWLNRWVSEKLVNEFYSETELERKIKEFRRKNEQLLDLKDEVQILMNQIAEMKEQSIKVKTR